MTALRSAHEPDRSSYLARHGPDSGLGGAWRVIVRNDDHNTFDHVAHTLAALIPGMSVDRGYRSPTASTTPAWRSCGAGTTRPPSTTGSSWATPGLTMAPLEQG